MRARRAWLFLCAVTFAVAAAAAPPANDTALYGRRDLATPRWLGRVPPAQRVQWQTSLEKAAANGDLEALKKLLAEGADPNALGWESVTALHAAAYGGHADAAAAL